MTISHSILLGVTNISIKISGENQNTHFVFNNFFFPKSRRLGDSEENYGRAEQVTDDNIIRCISIAS
jgi:hypothetical protein